jgi:hypothetical protein
MTVPISDYRDFYIHDDRLHCDKHPDWTVGINSVELPDIVYRAEGHYATDHAQPATVTRPKGTTLAGHDYRGQNGADYCMFWIGPTDTGRFCGSTASEHRSTSAPNSEADHG